MKKITIFVFTLLLVAATFAQAKTNWELAQEHRDYVKFSAYVPAREVTIYMGTDEELAHATEILKSIGVLKVFLDVYRSGYIPEKETLEQARDYLRAQGFEVSGGITTTKGGIFGQDSPTHKYFMCYDNDNTRKNLKYVSEYAASIFDEVIIDDFLATECRCDECAERKGDRDWPEYFRDVMVGISRDQIVGAMKAVNPDVTVIIKYPQWYDRFHMFGYDPGRQPEIFDLVWAGTETRDPDKENVQQYQGYVNYNWIYSQAGDKMRGAWFDQINTSSTVFVEQAFQSLLAGAREITLFGYSHEKFTSDNMKRLSENMEYLMRIAKVLRGKERWGVPAYKPLNSDGVGENFVFDFLGMFGLPILMTAHYPEDAPVVLLTRHAAADPDIAEKIKATVKHGGTVLMSAGLLEELKKDIELMKLAGLKPPGVKTLKAKMASAFRYELMSEDREKKSESKTSGPVEIGERIYTGDAQVLVSASYGDEWLPAIIKHETESGGAIVVFNARTFYYVPNSNDVVMTGPVSYINSLGWFSIILSLEAQKPIGLQVYSMDGPIGVYLIGDFLAVDNFSDKAASVTARFDKDNFFCDVDVMKNAYDYTEVRGKTGTEYEISEELGDEFVNSKSVKEFNLNIPARFMSVFELKCE